MKYPQNHRELWRMVKTRKRRVKQLMKEIKELERMDMENRI